MCRKHTIALFVGGCMCAVVVIWPVIYAYLHPEQDDRRQAEALLGIAKVDEAVIDFDARQGSYPVSLKQLVVPGRWTSSSLAAKDLNDPWGGTIRYDPTTLDPQTGRPRIYALSPDGVEICNFTLPIGDPD